MFDFSDLYFSAIKEEDPEKILARLYNPFRKEFCSLSDKQFIDLWYPVVGDVASYVFLEVWRKVEVPHIVHGAFEIADEAKAFFVERDAALKIISILFRFFNDDPLVAMEIVALAYLYCIRPDEIPVFASVAILEDILREHLISWANRHNLDPRKLFGFLYRETDRTYSVITVDPKLGIVAETRYKESHELSRRTVIFSGLVERVDIYNFEEAGMRRVIALFSGGNTIDIAMDPVLLDKKSDYVKFFLINVAKMPIVAKRNEPFVSGFVFSRDIGFKLGDRTLPTILNNPRIERNELIRALIAVNNIIALRNFPEFVFAFKVGLILPFEFARKQYLRGLRAKPILILYGAQNTGKSLLGAIIYSVWNIQEPIISGRTLKSEARLGEYISTTTFPLVVDEAEKLIESYPDMLKAIATGFVARSRLIRSGVDFTERRFPAFRPLILTMNVIPDNLMSDNALLDRCYVIYFGNEMVIENSLAFRNKIAGFLNDLYGLGNAIATLWLRGYKRDLWLESPISWIEEVLKKLYSDYLGNIPEWVEWRTEELMLEKANPEDEVLFAIKRLIAKQLRSSSIDENSIRNAAELAGFFIRNDIMYITSRSTYEISRMLNMQLSMRELSQMLNARLSTFRVNGRPTKAVAMPFSKILNLFGLNQKESAFMRFYDALKEISAEKGEITEDDLNNIANEIMISAEAMKQYLERLKMMGELYEVKPGVYKFVSQN